MTEEKMPALPEPSGFLELRYGGVRAWDAGAMRAFRAEGEADLRAQLTEAQQTLVDHGEIQASLCKQLTASEASRKELREFVEEVRRTGNTRLASMAIAIINKTPALANDAEQKGGA